MPNVPPPPVLTADDVGRTCLVTGGSGYLGRALVRRLLEAGCTVRTLDVQTQGPDPRATHHVADLRDPGAIAEAFAGVDTVFHTAAIISVVGEDLAPPALRRFVYGVNVVGTENVVRAARAAGVTAFVHTSSFNVVMDRPIRDGDESLPYAAGAFDLYSVTKIAAEKLALEADGKDGMHVAAIRPGGIWGSGRGAMMIDAFVEQLAKGAFVASIGDGNALLDNTHVENVVDAELLAARALRTRPETVGGRAYFVTDDDRYDGTEWFRPLVEGLGHRYPSAKIPAKVAMAIGYAGEVAHKLGAPTPTLTRRAVRNLTEGATFRIDRARADLGYEPRYGREHLVDLLPELKPVHDRLRGGKP